LLVQNGASLTVLRPLRIPLPGGIYITAVGIPSKE
jgi:hypothetical protein